MPGRLNAATLSTWPSVSSSRARPYGSQITASSPRASHTSSSISVWVRPGFRLGCMRHCVVVAAVPMPSTVIDPPSNTRGTGCTGWSIVRAHAEATAASRSQGANFSPQPLNVKSRAMRSPPSNT